MNKLSLFPTDVFIQQCKLNLVELEQQCINHKKFEKSSNISNIGGYQGHNFYSKNLFQEIFNNLPQVPNKPLKSIAINQWVNINKKGDSNQIHNHDPYKGFALSGVFYVRAPKSCGNIVFYDPRQYITTSPDHEYYNDCNDSYWIEPKENMLLIFPAWLYHSVDPNKSSFDRISISFNIKLNY